MLGVGGGGASMSFSKSLTDLQGFDPTPASAWRVARMGRGRGGVPTAQADLLRTGRR